MDLQPPHSLEWLPKPLTKEELAVLQEVGITYSDTERIHHLWRVRFHKDATVRLLDNHPFSEDLPGAALIDTKELHIVATIRWDTQSFDPSIYVVVDPSQRPRYTKNLVEDPDRSYLWLEDPIFLGSSEAEAQRLAVSGLRRALGCLARAHKT